MYVYVQTEDGCAVLGECLAMSYQDMLDAIDLYKPLAADVLFPDEPHCICCGSKIPDVTKAPLSRNGKYNFGDRRTIGGFMVVQGGKV